MDGIYVIFILMVHLLSFFLYFYTLVEVYLMLHIFIIQILGFLGLYDLFHPDNALEACGLLTPLHIVPEWYFLCQYAMLKLVQKEVDNGGYNVHLLPQLLEPQL